MENDRDKHTIPEALIDSMEEELPSVEEIDQYAAGEGVPKSCEGTPEECAAKILLALTHKVFSPREAKKIWRDAVQHEGWLTQKVGRDVGISVAVLDYLTNVTGLWEEAVVVESRQIKALTDAATIDALTGLYMKGIFLQWLDKAVAECQRYGSPLSLLMADIDDFKVLNDTHGHLVGDEVLRDVGKDFLQNLRASDFAARYGGEEFAAILPHTKIDTARLVAEKIRKKVKNRFHGSLDVKISIGVASWRDEMVKSSNLISSADKALYSAKSRGKNLVVTET
jgi:diguanylate cyclase (GGDEF)-like protein